MSEEGFPDGVYAVVSEGELEDATANGSRLVRMMGGRANGTLAFLLRRSRDQKYSDLRKSLSDQRETISSLKQENFRLQGEVHILKTNNKRQMKVVEEGRSRIEDLVSDRDRQLEDLANKRQTIEELLETERMAELHFGKAAWAKFKKEAT
jgi:predicted nuclease with TOPRIM domain